jgi:hypothetical protein
LRGLVRRDLPHAEVPAAECRVRISLAGHTVWPATDWQQVPADRVGVPYEFTATVKPGDRIEHVLAENPDAQHAGIGWYGVIEYVDD